MPRKILIFFLEKVITLKISKSYLYKYKSISIDPSKLCWTYKMLKISFFKINFNRFKQTKVNLCMIKDKELNPAFELYWALQKMQKKTSHNRTVWTRGTCQLLFFWQPYYDNQEIFTGLSKSNTWFNLTILLWILILLQPLLLNPSIFRQHLRPYMSPFIPRLDG